MASRRNKTEGEVEKEMGISMVVTTQTEDHQRRRSSSTKSLEMVSMAAAASLIPSNLNSSMATTPTKTTRVSEATGLEGEKMRLARLL